MSSTIYQNYTKRVLDFIFALLLLILLIASRYRQEDVWQATLEMYNSLY